MSHAACNPHRSHKLNLSIKPVAVLERSPHPPVTELSYKAREKHLLPPAAADSENCMHQLGRLLLKLGCGQSLEA